MFVKAREETKAVFAWQKQRWVNGVGARRIDAARLAAHIGCIALVHLDMETAFDQFVRGAHSCNPASNNDHIWHAGSPI